jgi:hypothetical protein
MAKTVSTIAREKKQQEIDEKCREELAKLLKTEKTHRQWKKQAINFLIFGLLVFVNLFRGSKKSGSIFGVKTCSAADWSAFGVFILICALLIFYAVRVN